MTRKARAGARFSALGLTLAYAGISFVMLFLFAAPLLYAWRSNIEQGRSKLLDEETQRLLKVYRARGLDALASSIDDQVGSTVTGYKIMLLADATGARVAGNLRAWPSGLPDRPGIAMSRVDTGEPRHVIDATFDYTPLPGGYRLLTGRDTTRYEPLEALYWWGLAVAAVLIIAVSFVALALIRRELLARIQAINRTASSIVTGQLSSRLPATGGGEDFDALAATVNRMLDQIEQLVHGIRDVSNAIAHDLRTPLTELRTRLEELRMVRPASDEAIEGIEAAVADVDRVIAIFNALLRLAEIESGARRSGFVPVDIARIVGEVTEMYQPVAEERGFALSTLAGEALPMQGDPLLLAQAIGNLVDNALKFARAEISVRAASMPDGAIAVSVADDGPGIPDSEKGKVVERFYRSDASRRTPGVGLGLSLVDAVARLHDGRLVLGDGDPGLCGRLEFPAGAARRG